MSAPSPGQRISDRYVLEGPIGGGGHGEIWSALDEQDGQRVALKFLREDLSGSVEAWAVLNHEAQMARRLNHPGVLRTGTPIRAGDRTVLPMEFAGGGDLRRLRGQSYLRSVPVLIRIAEILQHAHARGVVHRDLKPGNVLFDAQGQVRLADFGAAGLSGSRKLHAQGSPFTASPQQLLDEPASPADDIYGLGALAYELLAGNPPYYPDFSRERVLHEPVPPLVPAQPAPARLLALIGRMLEKDPAARPADMAAVIEGLNQALSDTLTVDFTRPAPVTAASVRQGPLAAVPVDQTELLPLPPRMEPAETLRAEPRPAAPSRALPVALWLGLGGLVAALAVAGWLIHRWTSESRSGAGAPLVAAAPEARDRPTPATPTQGTAVGRADAPPPSAPATTPPPGPARDAGSGEVTPRVPVPPEAAPRSDVPPEYARQMSRGAEWLAAQRYTDARAAYARALELAPGDAAARAALARVDAALFADGYEALKREAQSLERQERWREAERVWRRALEQDASLGFAQSGAKRAGERAELSERLDEFLQRPERFSSAQQREDARRWIQRARLLPDGPVLRSQIARIELLLAPWEQPAAR